MDRAADLYKQILHFFCLTVEQGFPILHFIASFFQNKKEARTQVRKQGKQGAGKLGDTDEQEK